MRRVKCCAVNKSFSVMTLLFSTAMLTLTVHAAEVICAEPHADGCPAQQDSAQGQPRSLRAAIDQKRQDLSDKLFGLQLSAFGDARSFYDDAGKKQLDWGLLELDASTDFSDDVQGAMAIVNDRAGSTLTVGFVDFHTFGGRIAPRGRLWVEKGFHVQAGRFDVPFGSDWQFFASKDSVSISRPLTTDIVMEGGYNDKGIRVLGNNGSVNFNSYLMQGFNNGRLLGGRFGITPFSDPFSLKSVQQAKTFEMGVSYFYDAQSSWKKNEIGLAVDSEVHLNHWSGKFEYLLRKKDLALGATANELRGWHVTQEYGLDEAMPWPTTLFARYEQCAISPAEIAAPGAGEGDAHDVRATVGFSTNVKKSDVVQLKFEVQHYLSATPTTRSLPGFGHNILWFTQLVVAL